MELDTAANILESLANNINPETGKPFAADSPYTSPGIIRALFTCVQHVRHLPNRSKRTLEGKQAENKAKGLPLNAGLPWTDESRARLARSFKTGEAPDELARQFERTKYAIVLELKKQGLLSEEDARRL